MHYLNNNIAYSNTKKLECVDHNYFHVGPPSLDSEGPVGCGGGRTVRDVVGGVVPEGTTSVVYTTTCAKSIFS